MQLDEILQLTRDLLTYNLDHYLGQADDTSDVTDAQLTTQYNRMQMRMSRKIWLFAHKVTFTIAENIEAYDLEDTTTPVLSKRMWKPMYVWINNVCLVQPNGSSFGLWEMGDIMRRPSWIDADADTPTRAVWMGSKKLLLLPKPAAADVTAGNNFIQGFIYADDLAGADPPNETPSEIPSDLHEALCWMAAYNAAIPTAAEADIWQRLLAYDSEVKDRVNDYAKMNKAAAAGGTAAPDSMRRVMHFGRGGW